MMPRPLRTWLARWVPCGASATPIPDAGSLYVSVGSRMRPWPRTGSSGRSYPLPPSVAKRHSISTVPSISSMPRAPRSPRAGARARRARCRSPRSGPACRRSGAPPSRRKGAPDASRRATRQRAPGRTSSAARPPSRPREPANAMFQPAGAGALVSAAAPSSAPVLDHRQRTTPAASAARAARAGESLRENVAKLRTARSVSARRAARA